MYRNHRQDIAALDEEDGLLKERIGAADARRREIARLRSGLVAGIQSACAHAGAYEFRLTMTHKGRCTDTRMRVCLECRLIESEHSLGQGFTKLKEAVRRRDAPMNVEQYRALQARIFEEDAFDA